GDGGGVGVRAEVRLEADDGVPDRDGRRERQEGGLVVAGAALEIGVGRTERHDELALDGRVPGDGERTVRRSLLVRDLLQPRERVTGRGELRDRRGGGPEQR